MGANLTVRRGSAVHFAKLSEDDVARIHRLVARRNRLKAELKLLTNDALARVYGVHPNTIQRTVVGELWSHVIPEDATQ